MNLNNKIVIAALAVSAFTVETSALQPKQYPDTVMIPERALIFSGSPEHSGPLMAVLYDTSDLHFSDPSAPRFLFLDRKGKVAFGIGGYIKGTMQYDFAGSIDDGASFVTRDIPVPSEPSQRSQFYGNANHSTIFMQLVGRSSRFGFYQMYIQTNFTGDGPKGYGLKLKQAYLKLGYVTAGLTNSTFVDGAAGTPTIDDQGPAGETGSKNILVRYAPRFSNHFMGAIGIEVPDASYTITAPADGNATVKKINQRVPDIPIYVQYEWGGGASHIRLSGLFRDLSYRDLITGRNRFKAGWAVQLSGKANFADRLTLFYQGAYGQGYGQYVNDLQDGGFDLVEASTPGRMRAPRTANFEIGARYNFRPDFFVSASYSQARLFGVSELGPDTYRYGQYLSVTGFYDIIPDLRVGLEYLHGSRNDCDGCHGSANRLIGMLQYSF